MLGSGFGVQYDRMVGRAGAKAGLIGAAVGAVLTVLSIVLGGQSPALGRVGGGLIVLAYVGTGLLAGSFLAVPRSAGMGARAGALAGLIGGAGSGVVWVIAVLMRMTQVRWDGWVPIIGLREMSPPAGLGMPAEVMAMLLGGVCGLISLFVGAGLGAAGGAVLGIAKRD